MTEDSSRRRNDLGVLAELVAAVGVAGVLTLILLYAIEVPRGGPYVFGTINDVLGGVYNLAIIPLILHLGRDGDPGRAWRSLTWATVIASVSGSMSSFLLVAKAIDFTPSATVSMLAFSVQCAWLLCFGLGDRSAPAVRRLARIAGAGTLAALPTIGLGFLLPPKSALQLTLFALGGAVGAASWLAVPVLWLTLGRQLRSKTA